MNRDELSKALASVAKDAGNSPDGRSAFAELIVETIQPNRLTLDLFSAYLPTRQLNVGDSLLKRTSTYGLPVRTMVPGTNHLADQVLPGREVLTYAIDYIIAKVRYSLWEIQRGEIMTLDQLRAEMQASLIDNLVARLQNLVGTVWTAVNTPSNYTTVSTEVSETALVNMMETVLEQAGNIRAIVGTRNALLPVYKFAGLYEQVKMISSPTTDSSPNVIAIPSILEEWRRTGRITSFRGAPLIELPQVYKRTYDAYDQKLIDDTKILVIGDNAGEAILYGGTEFQDNTERQTEPPEYTMAMWRGFGCIIDHPERVGVIKIV